MNKKNIHKKLDKNRAEAPGIQPLSIIEQSEIKVEGEWAFQSIMAKRKIQNFKNKIKYGLTGKPMSVSSKQKEFISLLQKGMFRYTNMKEITELLIECFGDQSLNFAKHFYSQVSKTNEENQLAEILVIYFTFQKNNWGTIYDISKGKKDFDLIKNIALNSQNNITQAYTYRYWKVQGYDSPPCLIEIWYKKIISQCLFKSVPCPVSIYDSLNPKNNGTGHILISEGTLENINNEKFPGTMDELFEMYRNQDIHFEDYDLIGIPGYSGSRKSLRGCYLFYRKPILKENKIIDYRFEKATYKTPKGERKQYWLQHKFGEDGRFTQFEVLWGLITKGKWAASSSSSEGRSKTLSNYLSELIRPIIESISKYEVEKTPNEAWCRLIKKSELGNPKIKALFMFPLTDNKHI